MPCPHKELVAVESLMSASNRTADFPAGWVLVGDVPATKRPPLIVLTECCMAGVQLHDLAVKDFLGVVSLHLERRCHQP